MWLPNQTTQPSRQHSLNPSLGFGEKAGAEQHNYQRINCAKPTERFFAIHERHRQIEEDKIEPVRAFPELVETFKARFHGCHLVAGFGKNAVRQKARGRLVIDNENPSRPDATGGCAAGNLGSV